MFNLWALLFERGMIMSEVNNSQIGIGVRKLKFDAKVINQKES